MKLIHISDVHLGSPLTAHLTPEKIRERRRELTDTLTRTVSEGRRLGARGVIIAGDLFDSENITTASLDAVIRLISENSDMTFFYLPGNHEGGALIKERVILKNIGPFVKSFFGFILSLI